MGSSTTAVLLAALVALAASSPTNPDKTTGAQTVDKIQRLLPDHLLISLLDQRVGDEEYTKLERMLVTAVLTFRDGLANPQPALGLPCLDPFDFTDGKQIPVNNEFASVNATLVSVHSEGISKFTVDKLALYLVERVGVLDITLPNFSADFVLDVPEGSWVSPLKLPLNDKFNVRFSSPTIKVDVRGKVSVKDGRLSMNSTKIGLDLGDWKFQILDQRSGPSTCFDNDGLCGVLAALVRNMAPWLLEEWKPVAEKYINRKLDKGLQELQLSDLIPPEFSHPNY